MTLFCMWYLWAIVYWMPSSRRLAKLDWLNNRDLDWQKVMRLTWKADITRKYRSKKLTGDNLRHLLCQGNLGMHEWPNGSTDDLKFSQTPWLEDAEEALMPSLSKTSQGSGFGLQLGAQNEGWSVEMKFPSVIEDSEPRWSGYFQ